MKKLMAIATTTLLASSAAFAGTQTVYSDTHIITDGFETEIEALNAGHDVIDRVKQLSSAQLRTELPTYAYSSVRDVKIDDAEVVIEAYSEDPGEVQYRAVVKVDYHYKAHESNS